MNSTVVARQIAGSVKCLRRSSFQNGSDRALRVGSVQGSLPVGTNAVSLCLTIVELFATAKNHRLARYVLRCPDEQVEAENALEWSWPEVVLCAFPPSCLVSHLFCRFMSQRMCRMLLVVQGTIDEPWISLHQMRPHLAWRLTFPTMDILLRQPHWDHSVSSEQYRLQLLCLSIAYLRTEVSWKTSLSAWVRLDPFLRRNSIVLKRHVLSRGQKRQVRTLSMRLASSG